MRPKARSRRARGAAGVLAARRLDPPPGDRAARLNEAGNVSCKLIVPVLSHVQAVVQVRLAAVLIHGVEVHGASLESVRGEDGGVRAAGWGVQGRAGAAV